MDEDFARTLLSTVEGLDEARFFARPVKEVLANQPKLWKKYEREISKPMDFATIRLRLEEHTYGKFRAFVNDLKLVFQNAMTFNASGSPVFEKAKEILQELNFMLKGGSAPGARTPIRAEQHDHAESSVSPDKLHTSEALGPGPEDEELDHGDVQSTQVEGFDDEEEGNESVAGELLRSRMGFYLPLPKARRLITESEQPLSLYQWEPDPTFELVAAARAAEMPLEQLVLPCFGVVLPANPDITTLRSLTASYKSLERERRPKLEEDPFLFEPKSRRDLQTFFAAYRRLIGDLIEQAIRRGVQHMECSLEETDPDFEAFEGTTLDFDELLDIFETEIPPAEFFLLFHSFATSEQIQRFESTLDDEDGPRMWVRVGPTEELKRMFGPASVYVPFPGLKDMYCAFQEPMLFFLEGTTMTLRACVSIVNARDLPKSTIKAGNSKGH